jgi:hypothetical protein
MPKFVMRRAAISLAPAPLFEAASVSLKSLWPEAVEGDFSFAFRKHGRVDPACLVHLDRSPAFYLSVSAPEGIDTDRSAEGNLRHNLI